jgi:tetratricopeptide (TPR) repeat protein
MRIWLTVFSTLIVTVLAAQQDPSPQALFENEQYEEVIAALPEPTTVSQMMLRADAHHKLGAFNDALDFYEAAEAAGCDSFELYLHRGICLFSLEAYDEARDNLSAAYDIDTGDRRIPYYFAAAAYMQNRFKEAERYLDDALERFPDYFDAHYLKGAVLLEQGFAAEAADAFTFCNALKPDDQRSKLNIAMALLAEEDYTKARDLLDEVVHDAQDDVLRDAYYQRGVCRYRTHDDKGACEDWANAGDLGDREAQELNTTVCMGKRKRVKERRGVYVAF